MMKPLTIACCILAFLPALGQGSSQTAVLDATPVAAALAPWGLAVSSRQITFLTEVRSDRTDPDLEVMSLDRWQDSSAAARLRCRVHTECLPFYVLLHWSSPRDAETALSQRSSPARGPRMGAGLPPRQWLIHTGELATLVIQDQDMRITVPVRCPSNAGAGDRLRVSTLDRRRYFWAEVVGAHLLKGDLR